MKKIVLQYALLSGGLQRVKYFGQLPNKQTSIKTGQIRQKRDILKYLFFK